MGIWKIFTLYLAFLFFFFLCPLNIVNSIQINFINISFTKICAILTWLKLFMSMNISLETAEIQRIWDIFSTMNIAWKDNLLWFKYIYIMYIFFPLRFPTDILASPLWPLCYAHFDKYHPGIPYIQDISTLCTVCIRHYYCGAAVLIKKINKNREFSLQCISWCLWS